MVQILKYVTGILLTSMFMFPVSLRVFPVNSKLIMAVIGMAILGFNAYRYGGTVSKKLWNLTLWSLGVSLCALISMVYNNSVDYSYIPYVVTMWVWLAAGYLVCYVIKKMHGRADLAIVSDYIIAMCVFQCVIAIMADYIPNIGAFFMRYWDFADFPAHFNRLYGFGACLDPAGIRFACVMVLTANRILQRNIQQKSSIPYWIAFAILATIGSIISRTALVGVGMFFLYMLVCAVVDMQKGIRWGIEIWKFVGLASLGILMTVYLFHTDAGFAKNIRFGFEPFFNYFEYGKFETTSTNILMEMYNATPQTLKTWIIGDGYLLSPTNIDPYYVGYAVDSEYYMGTDVGYYRFIFYFGLVGLTAFTIFLMHCMVSGMTYYPRDKWVFIFIFIINMVCWLKVGTDVFTLYAILLNADEEVDEEEVAV